MPNRDPLLSALGQRVRKLREAKNLTQEQLGEKAELEQFNAKTQRNTEVRRGFLKTTCHSVALCVHVQHGHRGLAG